MRTRVVAIDGTVYPVHTVAGFAGRVFGCTEHVLELRQPMGHSVKLSLPDLAKSLGGMQNALALFQDARAHDDAIVVRFELAGYAYHNTAQFMRFERARGEGAALPFEPTLAQRAAAKREGELALRRRLMREERGF